jgi:hypothetical protein
VVSGRHQPENGADSARPYRVSVVDRYDDLDRPRWITVPHAYGRHDVENQVADLDPALLILKVEEAA